MADRVRSVRAWHDQHGPYRPEVRETVLDALAEMLRAVPEERELDANQTERVELDLSIGRVLDDGVDRSL